MDILSDVNVSGDLDIGNKLKFHNMYDNYVELYQENGNTIRICGTGSYNPIQLSVPSFCIADNMAMLRFSSSAIYFCSKKLVFDDDGIYFENYDCTENRHSITSSFKTTHFVVPPNCSHFAITNEVTSWPAIASVWKNGKQIEIDLEVGGDNTELLGTIVPSDVELCLGVIYIPN